MKKSLADILTEILTVLGLLALIALTLFGLPYALPRPAQGATLASDSYCALSSEGLLWTGSTDTYTIFVRNPLKVAVPVNYIKVTTQIRPDAGQVPDPANYGTVVIQLHHAVAAPLAVTPIDFKADQLDPNANVDAQPECAAV